jgi:hypothetical protein
VPVATARAYLVTNAPDLVDLFQRIAQQATGE